MKRLLLSFCLSFAAFAVWAQLPDGSTAPNFNVTDLNGRVWNLYEILETNRPVIMDVSATWCGPCWAYHNSHALENYYAEHGPEGDAQSMVLLIEGDGATNIDCLYGLATCDGGTQGNWVAGTPYPIINNSGVFNSYQMTYFPTIMLICPDKKLKEVGQVNAAALWSAASACVGTIPTNYGKLKNMQANTRSLEICTPQQATPKVSLANFGSALISNAVVELRWNGALLQSKTFTNDDITVFDQREISFDPIMIAGAGTLSTEVISVNGQPNWQASTATVEFVDAPKAFSTQQVVLTIRTDATPNDTYWALYDDNGTLIDHGGNELVGPNGGGAYPQGAPADPSAYPANTTIKDTLNIPVNSCFTIQLVDAVGNGITPPGLMRLYDLGGASPFFTKVGNWGGNDRHTFAPKFTDVQEPTELSQMQLYPNPASDVLTLDFTMNNAVKCNIWVSNTTGQRVRTIPQLNGSIGSNQVQLPLEGLANGVYFVSLQTNTGITTRRFVVEK